MKFVHFDIFPKIRADYSRRTAPSGFITVFSISIMVVLFFSHFISYFTTTPSQKITIDESPLPQFGNGTLDIKNLPSLSIFVDILLEDFPCPFVDFGVIDLNKEVYTEATHQIRLESINPKTKARYTRPQKPLVQLPDCGSCYGAASGCCNTCGDVKRAFEEKGRKLPSLSTIEQCKPVTPDFDMHEQCHIRGFVNAPPVSGVIFISPGNSYSRKTPRSQFIEDYLLYNLTINDFNMSHLINHIVISDGLNDIEIHHDKCTLENVHKKQQQKGRMKYMYHITSIKEKLSSGVHYRMSATVNERYRNGPGNKFPGIFISYEVAPIMVEYKRDVSFLHFLVNLMAILGGVFSFATLLDHLLTPLIPKEGM